MIMRSESRRQRHHAKLDTPIREEMDRCQFVCQMLGKPKMAVVGKGELVAMIVAQYHTIVDLGREVYKLDPKHKMFEKYSEEQMEAFKPDTSEGGEANGEETDKR